MKKHILTLSLLLSYVFAMAQSITLKFTAQGQYGNYHEFSSVKVENLTRNWQHYLTYPDTVLVLQVTDGICELNETGDGLSLLGPNPFMGTTQAKLLLSKDGKVEMKVLQIDGKLVARYEGNLPQGTHCITFNAEVPQMYLLVVSTAQGSFATKLMNTGYGSSNGIEVCMDSKEAEKSDNTKSRDVGYFLLGDQMRYTAFGTNATSNTLTKHQYGSENIVLQFPPAAGLPTVTTLDATFVAETSAIGNGNVVSGGSSTVTERGICWSTTQNPNINGTHASSGSGVGNFSVSMIDLSPGTTYYVRAYAVNSVGTAYGEQKTFVTLDVPHLRVSTDDIEEEEVTTSSATCGGYVVNNGVAVTACGVCWSTNQNPTISDSHTTDGSAAGSFTSKITGLTPGTTYYVRAYATNSTETVYGSQKTFTTLMASELTMKMFSVSSTKKVYFSKGNLQYQATTNTWRFAESQLEIMGEYDNENISPNYSGWIDLFCWGTGNNPTNHVTDHSGENSYPAFNDWGINPISNGGNQTNMWRTLTKDEWEYLLNTRTTNSGIRYAKAEVNGRFGLIILPDDWNASFYTLNNTNDGTGWNWSDNTIPQAYWTSLFEAHGAIFLPRAGLRDGVTYDDDYDYYWSSTPYSIHSSAYHLKLSSASVDKNWPYRYIGLSVRLVKNAN